MPLWRIGEMSLGVPIAILVALATSLSAQFYMSWPNYKSEQKERSEQADESSSKDKDKSEQTDESSSKDKSAKSDEKDKAAKSDETSSAGVSNGKRNPRKRRQD
jgi:cytoskeletal protein RodZ